MDMARDSFKGYGSIIVAGVGSSNPRVYFPNLVELYSAGKLKLNQMITGKFPLDRINGAFEDLPNGIGVRSIIVFDCALHSLDGGRRALGGPSLVGRLARISSAANG